MGKGYLYGQGSFSYTAIAQHHQLVQRHLPRHGVGRRSESASSMQVVSSARMRRTGHRSRASCYASEARHVVAESRLVFCSEFAADQRAHSLGWEQWCRSRRGVRRRRGEARPESASMSWFQTAVHNHTAAAATTTGARVDGELQALQNRSGGGVGSEDNGCTRRRRDGSVACAAGPTQKRRQE